MVCGYGGKKKKIKREQKMVGKRTWKVVGCGVGCAEIVGDMRDRCCAEPFGCSLQLHVEVVRAVVVAAVVVVVVEEMHGVHTVEVRLCGQARIKVELLLLCGTEEG